MLVHRPRRWPNIIPIIHQRIVFAGKYLRMNTEQITRTPNTESGENQNFAETDGSDNPTHRPLLTPRTLVHFVLVWYSQCNDSDIWIWYL